MGEAGFSGPNGTILSDDGRKISFSGSGVEAGLEDMLVVDGLANLDVGKAGASGSGVTMLSDDCRKVGSSGSLAVLDVGNVGSFRSRAETRLGEI